MEVRLVVRRGRTTSNEIVLRKFPLVVGRRVECNLRITSRMVSRKHCILEERNGVLVVRDLQSANGTFVNGAQIDTETIVKPGDQLEIGSICFHVEYDAPGGEGAGAEEAISHETTGATDPSAISGAFQNPVGMAPPKPDLDAGEDVSFEINQNDVSDEYGNESTVFDMRRMKPQPPPLSRKPFPADNSID